MQFATVPLGGNASPLVTLDRPDRVVAVFVPSGVVSAVRLQYAMTGDVNSAGPWFTLCNPPTGVPTVIASGPGGTGAVGVAQGVPTPWVRIELGAAAAAVKSFGLAGIVVG